MVSSILLAHFRLSQGSFGKLLGDIAGTHSGWESLLLVILLLTGSEDIASEQKEHKRGCSAAAVEEDFAP